MTDAKTKKCLEIEKQNFLLHKKYRCLSINLKTIFQREICVIIATHGKSGTIGQYCRLLWRGKK